MTNHVTANGARPRVFVSSVVRAMRNIGKQLGGESKRLEVSPF
jgi:hypothetical protein